MSIFSRNWEKFFLFMCESFKFLFGLKFLSRIFYICLIVSDRKDDKNEIESFISQTVTRHFSPLNIVMFVVNFTFPVSCTTKRN